MKFKAIISVIGTPSLKKGGVYDTSDFSKDDQAAIKNYIKAGHCKEVKIRRRKRKPKS